MSNVLPAIYHLYGIICIEFAKWMLVIPMSAVFSLEMLVTVTFEEYEGKTKLILRHVGIPAGAERDVANVGWNQSLDKVADEYVS